MVIIVIITVRLHAAAMRSTPCAAIVRTVSARRHTPTMYAIGCVPAVVARHCLPRIAQDVFRLDYMLNVDMREFRLLPDGGYSLYEITKYTCKPNKILTDTGIPAYDKDMILAALSGAIHGRQMHTYGGEVQKIYRELFRSKNAEDVEDMIHCDTNKDNEQIVGTVTY